MSNDASQFIGDIPANYDRELGPILFDAFGDDLARRAAARAPKRVLELAAGTGIVSQKLRAALPDDAHLTITDLNAPMLEIARAKLQAAPNVDVAVADAMQLAFPDKSFDLVVCQFGVMFFPDKVAAFREARRVLSDTGALAFNAWGTRAENVYAAIAQDLCEEMFPHNPPGFYRVPFSYHDATAAKADLKAAGFATLAHEALQRTQDVLDVAAFAHGLVFGNPFADELRTRGADPAAIVPELERRLRAALGATHAVLPLKAHVFVAMR